MQIKGNGNRPKSQKKFCDRASFTPAVRRPPWGVPFLLSLAVQLIKQTNKQMFITTNVYLFIYYCK